MLPPFLSEFHISQQRSQQSFHESRLSDFAWPLYVCIILPKFVSLGLTPQNGLLTRALVPRVFSNIMSSFFSVLSFFNSPNSSLSLVAFNHWNPYLDSDGLWFGQNHRVYAATLRHWLEYWKYSIVCVMNYMHHKITYYLKSYLYISIWSRKAFQGLSFFWETEKIVLKILYWKNKDPVSLKVEAEKHNVPDFRLCHSYSTKIRVLF